MPKNNRDVSDWKNSRHGHVGVSCIDCHGVDTGSETASQNCPGVKGTQTFIFVIVTPKTCSRCHASQVDQFNHSGHFRARLQYKGPDGINFKGMSALIEKHEGQGLEFQQCPRCLETRRLSNPNLRRLPHERNRESQLNT